MTIIIIVLWFNIIIIVSMVPKILVSSIMDDETVYVVRFVADDTIDTITTPYSIEGNVCDLSDSKANNDDCFIIRHWTNDGGDQPVTDDSFISCKSNIFGKKSFLIWQWFPFDAHKNSGVNFNIECPEDLYDYHECTSLDDQLTAYAIIQTKDSSDSIVVMRFCTNDGFDAVEYRVQFNEERPLFTQPHNYLTMASNIDESVKVPQMDDIFYYNYYIVVDGYGNSIQPIEIQSLVKGPAVGDDSAVAIAVTSIVCSSMMALIFSIPTIFLVFF